MSQPKPRIIILDEDMARYQAVRAALPDIGIKMSIDRAASPDALPALLAEGQTSLLLCAPDSEAEELVRIRIALDDAGYEIPVVAFTDLVQTDSIVSLVSKGADDVADINRSDHLTLVAARHLGALNELRQHWRMRDTTTQPQPQDGDERRNQQRDAPEVWRQRVQEAVRNQKFSLSRQRIASLDSNEEDEEEREYIDILLRVEVEHQDGESRLPAARFIDEAVEAGLAPVIDAWVLHEVCQQVGILNAEGSFPLCFVRITSETLAQANVSKFVDKSTKQHKARADCLSLEISEQTLTGAAEPALKQLQTLRELGCVISLSHVAIRNSARQWPEGVQPDFIKLDPAELADILDSGNTDPLQQLVQRMHADDIGVIAPQVEQADALAMIWSCGVDYAQGFYQSHPQVVISSDHGNPG